MSGEDDDLAVLADDLQQRGDPHGELIARYVAIEQSAGLKQQILQRRAATIAERYHDRLFGALAPHVPCTGRPDLHEPALVIDAWRNGFADEVTIRAGHARPSLDEVYRIARTLPIASRMRTLRIASGYGAAFERAIVDDPPARLRDLQIAYAPPERRSGLDYDDEEDDDDGLFDLARLVPVIQRLEVFRVGNRAELPPLESDTLRSIGLVAQGEGISFAQSRLPNLQRLDIMGTFEVGFCASFPSLEALSLGSDYGPGFLDELLASPMLVRLRELDIRLEEEELELFMQHPERLAHLERCSIGLGWFPGREALQDAARAVLPPKVSFV